MGHHPEEPKRSGGLEGRRSTTDVIWPFILPGSRLAPLAPQDDASRAVLLPQSTVRPGPENNDGRSIPMDTRHVFR